MSFKPPTICKHIFVSLLALAVLWAATGMLWFQDGVTELRRFLYGTPSRSELQWYAVHGTPLFRRLTVTDFRLGTIVLLWPYLVTIFFWPLIPRGVRVAGVARSAALSLIALHLLLAISQVMDVLLSLEWCGRPAGMRYAGLASTYSSWAGWAGLADDALAFLQGKISRPYTCMGPWTAVYVPVAILWPYVAWALNGMPDWTHRETWMRIGILNAVFPLLVDFICLYATQIYAPYQPEFSFFQIAWLQSGAYLGFSTLAVWIAQRRRWPLAPVWMLALLSFACLWRFEKAYFPMAYWSEAGIVVGFASMFLWIAAEAIVRAQRPMLS